MKDALYCARRRTEITWSLRVCHRCLSNPCPVEDEHTAPAPAVSMPAGATPFVDDLLPAATTPTPAPAPVVDDGWASLGFSAATPAPTPAPAPVPAPSAGPPTAQDYLSQLKQQQDASLLMQSNPRDQAYYESQLAQGAANSPQADAMVAAPPPVVRLPTSRPPIPTKPQYRIPGVYPRLRPPHSSLAYLT